MSSALEVTPPTLPDFVELTEAQLEKYYDLFWKWKALGKRFLPSQILAEDEETLSVLLQLESLTITLDNIELEKKNASSG